MRSDDWFPTEGMLFVVPPFEDEPATTFKVWKLNDLCRCKQCPCYLGAIWGLHAADGYFEGWWAGGFSLAELRAMEFAPDNTITQPDRRRLVQNRKTGGFSLAEVGEPVQGALL